MPSEGGRGTSIRQRANLLILSVALAAAAAVLFIQLFVPPVVGLADNRDYERVMGYAGFQHTTDDDSERYFRFVRTQYAVVDPGWFRGGYHTSETLLAFLARWIHLAFSSKPVFDIRELAAIHVLLFLLALAGLIRATRDLAIPTQALVAALLVFVFTDVGYVSLFNTFYSQTASLLFLLLTAAVAAEAIARGRLAGFRLLLYFGFALLFVASKPQERLAAPLLALLGWRLAGGRFARAWKQAAAWLGVGLCAFSIWYARHTPYTLREATLFQLVFEDVLVHASSPQGAAAELGLDPGWIRYRGTNAYAKDSPLLGSAFRREFLHRVGYRGVLRYYGRHPAELVGRVRRAASHAWSLRPSFGNFEKSAEHPDGGMATRFTAWSRARGALGANPLFWAALLLGGNAAIALATYRRSTPRGRLFREGTIVAAGMASIAFGVCALAQAPTDLSRALFAFHALCDLLLIADAGWLTQALVVRRAAPGPASSVPPTILG